MDVRIGEIVLIPFPYTDLKSQKRRPVLAIANSDTYGDFVCLAITSKSHHLNAIDLTQKDMESGQIPKASWIRTDKVFTLNNGLIAKRVGFLKEEITLSAVKQICKRVAFIYGKEHF